MQVIDAKNADNTVKILTGNYPARFFISLIVFL